MRNSGSESNRTIVLGLVSIVFLITLLYVPILNAPFVFDDSITITYNSVVKGFSSAFRDISNNRYVGMLTFAVNYSVGGLKPFGYHIVNVLLHAANALLVYVLISLIFKSPALSGKRFDGRFIAFSAAFLFAVHPIQTQAVAYVSQRFTLMTTFFYLSSIIFYMKMRLLSAEEGTKKVIASPKYYLFSLLLAALAMKTKEIAITIPFAVALCEISFFSAAGKGPKRFFPVLPYFLVLLVIPLTLLPSASYESAVTLVENVDRLSKDDMVPFSRMEYFISQFKVVVLYLRLLVLPVKQIFDYAYPASPSFFAADVLLSFLFLAAIFAAGIMLFRRHRIVGFSVLWFFLTLSVESSIIPIRDIANEHRVYLPSAGFFLLAVSLVDSSISGRRTKIAVAAVLVSVLSIMTIARIPVWKDPEYLWQDVIEKAPHNARAYGSLGIIYKKDKEYDKALEMLEKTKTLGKAYPEVFLHLGDIYYEKGDYEKALMHLKVADELDVTSKIRLSVLNKLGRTYEKLGNTVSAADAFQQAIKLYPKSTTPYNNLGVLFIRQQKYDEAIETLQAGLRNYEADYLYKNLIEAFRRKGDSEKAEAVQKQYDAFMLKMGLAKPRSTD